MTINNGCQIVVFGNEKGGSGKSTTAMHVAVALMKEGIRVGTVDLDARQGTLTRFIENRCRYVEETGIHLTLPHHRFVEASSEKHTDEAMADDERRLFSVLNELSNMCDVIVIDSPGNASHLSHVGHSYAQTLVTPMNDSFIDLDVLARVSSDHKKVEHFSHYASMVFEERKKKAARSGQQVDWIVLKNRLSFHKNVRNRREVDGILAQLSRLIGFRVVSGIGERVIYRELFPKGLTALDLEAGDHERMSLSHVAAAREVRNLVKAIGIGKATTAH